MPSCPIPAPNRAGLSGAAVGRHGIAPSSGMDPGKLMHGIMPPGIGMREGSLGCPSRLGSIVGMPSMGCSGVGLNCPSACCGTTPPNICMRCAGRIWAIVCGEMVFPRAVVKPLVGMAGQRAEPSGPAAGAAPVTGWPREPGTNGTAEAGEGWAEGRVAEGCVAEGNAVHGRVAPLVVDMLGVLARVAAGPDMMSATSAISVDVGAVFAAVELVAPRPSSGSKYVAMETAACPAEGWLEVTKEEMLQEEDMVGGSGGGGAAAGARFSSAEKVSGSDVSGRAGDQAGSERGSDDVRGRSAGGCTVAGDAAGASAENVSGSAGCDGTVKVPGVDMSSAGTLGEGADGSGVGATYPVGRPTRSGRPHNSVPLKSESASVVSAALRNSTNAHVSNVSKEMQTTGGTVLDSVPGTV
mmetsp:Transcript_26435/g.57032  ORF Transcript_26435/g.57032 Transcript_26435/m.57032 type:complete len:411 (+) Transcript_26435:482-1714(+)